MCASRNVDNRLKTGVEVLISVPQDTVADIEVLISELTSGQAVVEPA